MEELSLRTRSAHLQSMADEGADLLVIGGGITGAGIAQDAAARGVRVALVEKGDFACGTSSRTTKLIHGGLRYLEQMEFRLVREALLARRRLHRLAPHLAQPMEFLIPVYQGGWRRARVRLGLILYDLLAGSRNIGKHRPLSPPEMLERAPLLRRDGLLPGFSYFDCVTDDARLTVEVVKSAARHGARVANYARVTGFEKADGRIERVLVRDELTGRALTVRAAVVLNATGVWSDQLRLLDEPCASPCLRPAKGIHLVFAADRLPLQSAVLIPSLRGSRFYFLVPWQGSVIAGTTDTDYRGDLDSPEAQPAEIEEILASIARYFPESRLTAADCLSSYAGIRPLVSNPNGSSTEVSRADEIFESESGMVTITGGKLTNYQNMARRALEHVRPRLPRLSPSSRIGNLPLAGGPWRRSMADMAGEACVEYGISRESATHLIRTHGLQHREILELTRREPTLRKPLSPQFPHLQAEVLYAARHEMAATAEDILLRRTRIGVLSRDGGQAVLPAIERILESELQSATV